MTPSPSLGERQMTQTPLTDAEAREGQLFLARLGWFTERSHWVSDDFARSLERQLSECQAALREVASSGVEYDGALGYVTVQVNRSTWESLAALAAKGEKE